MKEFNTNMLYRTHSDCIGPTTADVADAYEWLYDKTRPVPGTASAVTDAATAAATGVHCRDCNCRSPTTLCKRGADLPSFCQSVTLTGKRAISVHESSTCVCVWKIG